jgi:hypothetical protein
MKEIVRICEIQQTARVMQLEGMFDLPASRVSEQRWSVNLRVERRRQSHILEVIYEKLGDSSEKSVTISIPYSDGRSRSYDSTHFSGFLRDAVCPSTVAAFSIDRSNPTLGSSPLHIFKRIVALGF